MRILFFMLMGKRTGSEVALYNLICHAAGEGFEMAVACSEEGELLKQLPASVPVFVYEKWGWAQRAYAGVYRRLLDEENSFTISIHRKFKPDLWYINTVTQAALVRQAKKHHIPCVLHTHELEQMLAPLNESDTTTMVSYPRLVIASSEAAADVFRLLGRRDHLGVCYATINPARIKWSPERSKEIRRSLGIADETFVWATVANFDPNKNPVRFVEVAGEVLRQGSDAHFLWIGGGQSGYSLYVKVKASELGIAGKVSFTGARAEDYYDWLNAADGLLVTSYKESFSIASVEAAYLGKPVVSFDCRGVREIVREGMGIVIDSWNDADLVRAMLAVMKGEIHFDARLSAERVREFYIDAQGPRWASLMREHFAG
jgi:glycosyltransferase involved in cell wall biosynthesis